MIEKLCFHNVNVQYDTSNRKPNSKDARIFYDFCDRGSGAKHAHGDNKRVTETARVP